MVPFVHVFELKTLHVPHVHYILQPQSCSKCFCEHTNKMRQFILRHIKCSGTVVSTPALYLVLLYKSPLKDKFNFLYVFLVTQHL